MIADAELLRRYAEERSEAAFAELVRRHLNLVYAAALRRTNGDAHRAADISQIVFTSLAREASKLAHHTLLAGWIYTATRNAAHNTIREDQRRRAREQAISAMQETTTHTAAEADWSRLRPELDRAIDELSERDRTAVLARFFEGRAFAEIGAALKISDDAARMRVERALEKLRALLARRDVTSTGAALGLMLANEAACAAPAGLAQVVTGAALAGGTTSSVAGVVTIFAMTKLELGTLTLLLAAGATMFTWERGQTRDVAAEIAALRSERTQLVALQIENHRLATRAAANLRRDQRPLSPATSTTGSPITVDEATAGLIAAGMKPMSAWSNLGRATAAEAFETMLWARLTGDFDVLATTIAFVPEGKARLDAWFLTLPPAVRAKYGTAERVIAPVFAADFPWLQRLQPNLQNSHQPFGYKLVAVGERDRGGHVPMEVLFSDSSDADRPERIHMWSSPDGWRNARFIESMVDRFVTRIDPATGEPRAASVSISP